MKRRKLSSDFLAKGTISRLHASNSLKGEDTVRRLFCALLSLTLCLFTLLAQSEEFDKDFRNITRPGAELIDAPVEMEALPLKGVKIGIDPGHQLKGNNEKEADAPGSSTMKAKVSTGTRGVSTGIPEYQTDLDIALLLRDALTALGAEVKMTRETNDVDISNQERAIVMNEWGADFVIRIHCNGSTDQSASGAGMYVRKTGVFAEESAALGSYLLSGVCEIAGAKRTGVYKRDTYTGLNWSEVPCVLAELGYMTNPEEDKKLNDPEYQRLLVIGLATGMSLYAQEYLP